MLIYWTVVGQKHLVKRVACQNPRINHLVLVHHKIYKHRLFAFNGLLQYGDDFLFFCNSETACTVRLCHFYKIRAGDFSFGIMLVIEFFLPLAHHTRYPLLMIMLITGSLYSTHVASSCIFI